MRIGICGTASDGGKSGISVYLKQMVAGLAAAGPAHQFELLVDEDEAPFFAAGGDVAVVRLSRRLRGPVQSILWHQVVLPFMVTWRRYDVMFVPAGNRRLPFHAGCPTVGTVHDLASFHVTGKYDCWRDVYVKRVLPHLIRRLTRIIAPSRATAEDIVRHCGVPADRITMIPEAVDTARFSPGDREGARQAVRQLGIEPPFILYVSRIEHPGKNHVRLIDAFARLRARGAPHRLVFAGADRERAEEVHQRALSSGCGGQIDFLGYVPDGLLVSLYRAADALAFPSLYEGFGLPVLEAMACGVPVACSSIASLPEVAGSAALYFNPASVESIAETLEVLLRSERLREILSAASQRRAAEFSIPRSARRTLDVVEQAARGGQLSPSSRSLSSKTL